MAPFFPLSPCPGKERHISFPTDPAASSNWSAIYFEQNKKGRRKELQRRAALGLPGNPPGSLSQLELFPFTTSKHLENVGILESLPKALQWVPAKGSSTLTQSRVGLER